jgi:hypothetical protein
VSLARVRVKVEEVVGASSATPAGSPPFTPRAKKVLELSLREALQLGHNYIGTEHLLLGLLREGEGVAALVLVSLGADLQSVREQVMQVLDEYRGPEAEANSMSRPATRPSPHLEPEQDTFTERVGMEWNAQVVRVGRTPGDYEAAFGDLRDMFASMDVTLDESDLARVDVRSVQTRIGPGIALSLTYRVDESPDPGMTTGND